MMYMIANWSELFETAETRKLAQLRWCPSPNKLDGLGFRRMASQRDRCELFAAWNIMRAIASKTMPRERRGWLERNGRSLTADDMAVMSGFPPAIFTRALTFFSSEEVGWLVAVNSSTQTDCGPVPAEPPARPADDPVLPASLPAEGIEGKEGKERKSLRYPADAGSGFVEVFEKWMGFRKGMGKKPSDWDSMFQEQLDWIAKQPKGDWLEIPSQSIRNGWQGLFAVKQNGAVKPPEKPKGWMHPDNAKRY